MRFKGGLLPLPILGGLRVQQRPRLRQLPPPRYLGATPMSKQPRVRERPATGRVRPEPSIGTVTPLLDTSSALALRTPVPRSV
jgi:hypothetical protein